MADSLGLDDGTKDIITLHDGMVLQTHGPRRCAGFHCCIHNPSDHPLRNAPMVWLGQLNLMMRICKHEELHPDPDSMNVVAARLLNFEGWHPCCEGNCCSPA